MQRLTKNNKTFIDCDECYDERVTCGYCETITKAVQKLADYEDLEEQGLLVRKKGKWELLDDCANAGVYCSNCSKKVYRVDYANQKVKSKYCPACGAKMEE